VDKLFPRRSVFVKRFTHEMALGLTMTCYTAEPGTASEENLQLLASWAATMEQDTTAPDSTSERHPAQ
jgi:hypothetical protein